MVLGASKVTQPFVHNTPHAKTINLDFSSSDILIHKIYHPHPVQILSQAKGMRSSEDCYYQRLDPCVVIGLGVHRECFKSSDIAMNSETVVMIV